jgi:predicted enzyme related to lactoylglutathione lyase
VHAAALRTALSKKGTLGYGELLDALLDDRRSWGAQPSLDVLPPGWREAWKESIGSDFWRTWTDTVDEMISLLSIARQGMSSGALASERETLDALGSTHSKVMGAGTVTAAAAAFLASRSAANPRSGLLAAAFIPRADSDTLASMTTSLLAALGREDWLFPLNREVQDVAYLERLGGAVVSAPRGATMRRPRVTSNQTRALLSRIDHASPDDLVELPDGRYANVVAVEPLRSLVQSSVAATYRLSVDDGQTMHVVRVHRRSEGPRSTQQVFPIDDRESRGVVLPAVLHVGMILPVSDLEKMRSFYENLLGLAVTRIGSSFVTFNDVLALSTAAAPPLPSTGRLRVYVEVSSVQQVWDRLQQHGVDIVEPLGRGSGRKRFTCLDPEGNVIELIEPPPAPMAIEGHFAGHDRTSGRPKVI